jgi:Na+/phosphate symporter
MSQDLGRLLRKKESDLLNLLQRRSLVEDEVGIQKVSSSLYSTRLTHEDNNRVIEYMQNQTITSRRKSTSLKNNSKNDYYTMSETERKSPTHDGLDDIQSLVEQANLDMTKKINEKDKEIEKLKRQLAEKVL